VIEAVLDVTGCPSMARITSPERTPAVAAGEHLDRRDDDHAIFVGSHFDADTRVSCPPC
jgi:hypothetical protein